MLKRSPNAIVLRVNTVEHAWATTCPEETFFGRTLEQYRAEIKAVFDVRAEAAEIDARWTGVMAKRDDVDTAANELTKNIVRSVRAHPRYGEDSPLYATMGFTRESDRASRRKRPERKPEVEPPVQEAAPADEKS